MPNSIDLTGQRFERLLVLHRAGWCGEGKMRRTLWQCRGSSVVTTAQIYFIGVPLALIAAAPLAIASLFIWGG
jgi:hypothetical protein